MKKRVARTLRSRYGRVATFLAAVVLVQLLAHAAGKPFFLTQLTMAAYYTLVATTARNRATRA